MSKKRKKTDQSDYWLDRPKNVRKVIIGFYALCGLVLLVDLVYSIFFHKHSAFDPDILIHDLEIIPAFYGFYGFAACVGLVYVSKLMRGWKEKKFLMRDENYWEK